MRWLIVEDALKDRRGHWLEWVRTFHEGFQELGDEVVVLADAQVDAGIRDSLNAQAILPPSIWHRMGDESGPLTRYGRVLAHGWRTRQVMDAWFRANETFDAVFVPTVLVHHLIAWAWLIKRRLKNTPTRVLLFFLTAPIRLDPETGTASLDGSPSAKLLVRLLKWIEPEIRTGKVVLGVETKAMQKNMEALTGVPFVYFPQPVHPVTATVAASSDSCVPLEMACYGAARAEKGSDVLQDAITLHRHRYPGSRGRFTIQWIEDFVVGNRAISRSPELQGDPRMQFLTRYFNDGEYPRYLARTHVLLLPYRLSSYALRGSRVVIEAVVNGIPVVATRGTTLAGVAADFGSGLYCEDGDCVSLAAAIREMELKFEEMSLRARMRKDSAASFFSVATFRKLFLTNQPHPVSAGGQETANHEFEPAAYAEKLDPP